eukprot:157177_1
MMGSLEPDLISLSDHWVCYGIPGHLQSIVIAVIKGIIADGWSLHHLSSFIWILSLISILYHPKSVIIHTITNSMDFNLDISTSFGRFYGAFLFCQVALLSLSWIIYPLCRCSPSSLLTCMRIACGFRSTHIPSVSFIWTQTMVLHAIPWPLRCFSTPVLSLSWAWSFYLVIGANLRDFIYHYLLSSLLPVVVEPMASFGARHLVSLSPTGCVIVFSSVISLILSIVVRPKLVQARCVPYSMSGCLISLIFDALWSLTVKSYMSYTAKGGVGLLFLNVPCLFSVRSGHTITRPITLYNTTVIAPGDIANFSVMSCIISLFYLYFLCVSIHYVISCLILINFMFCLCIISLFYLHYLCVLSDLFSHIYAVFFLTYLPIFMLCLILINKRRIECYKRRIELYKRRIELYKRRIELYKRRIELYKRRIELYKRRIEL